MSLYEDVLKKLKYNKQRRLKGDLISIPWFKLPKLNKVLPGIMQSQLIVISANQKVGKTQLADFLYLYQPIQWLYENRDSNIDVDILYFSLEMRKEAKIMQAMSFRIYDKYGISISPQKLQSVFEDYILDDKIEEIIEAESDWFEFFQSKVTFIDTIRNPYGIYLTAKKKFLEDGHYVYKEGDVVNYNTGEATKGKIIDRYIPNNPDKFRIIMTDTVNLLNTEKEDSGSLYSAIGRFSSKYCLNLRDRFGATVVNIQQQMPTSEEEQFNFGKSVINKVKPSAAKLGDNKSTARDCDIMLSLFDPARYNTTTYKGLDLTEMEGTHRELYINLNRHGMSSASIQLIFNGASNHFEEIDTKDLMSVYYKIKNAKYK